MNVKGWSESLESILESVGDGQIAVDNRRLRTNVNAYLVRSIDGTALQFSIPILIPDPSSPPPDLPAEGIDGAALVHIEHIKSRVRDLSGLRPIAGLDTQLSAHYAAVIEPVTFIHSPGMMGHSLWKADSNNFFSSEGLHLVVRGAIPYPGPPDSAARRIVAGHFSDLVGDLADVIQKAPVSRMAEAQLISADQKLLRRRLFDLGLVCFIGDGSRIARTITRYRPYYRIAGPKIGLHVPFFCPEVAMPIEVDLPFSNETITGLGIRKGEILAITGSNAEGKSTILEGIIAGEDDHAPGDGREHLVTVPGAASAEAGAEEMRGDNISLFFSRLPPGIDGSPKQVFGKGSGSMVMAAKIQRAVSRKCPILLLDEDRSATNLLVPCSTHDEGVIPFSTIIAQNRDGLEGMAVIIAAGTMDFLTAQADRIITLEDHEAHFIDRVEFRRRLKDHLFQMGKALEEP
jgi:predicted ABC-class ATPase